MGEAKRRKTSGRGFGKNVSDLSQSVNSEQTSVIKQTGQNRHLLESVEVMGSPLLSVHIMVCSYPELFNRAFCQIKTVDKVITFWANQPFNESGRVHLKNHQWSTVFTSQIINGVKSSCQRKFSMKSIPESFTQDTFEYMLIIEDVVRVKVSCDYHPESINLQIPIPPDKLRDSDDILAKINNDMTDVEVYQHYSPIQFQNLLKKGIEEFKQGNIDTAIKHLSTAFDLSSKLKNISDEQYISINYILGKCYESKIEKYKSENTKKAIFYLENALKKTKIQKDIYTWIKIQQTLGNLYLNHSLKEKNIENQEKTISHLEPIIKKQILENIIDKETIQTIITTKITLGGFYLERIKGEKVDNIEMAIQYLNESLFEVEKYIDKLLTKKIFIILIKGGLGTAYARRILGNKNDNLKTALSYCLETINFFSDNNHYDLKPEILNQLGKAKLLINLGSIYGELLDGDRNDNLEKSILYFEQALEFYSENDNPSDWALIQHNLGCSYSERIKGNENQNIEKAIKYLENSLRHKDSNLTPTEWANTKWHLGRTYIRRVHGDKVKNIETGINHLEEALEKYPRQLFPIEWAKVQVALGQAIREKTIFRHLDEKDSFITESPLIYYQNALEEYTYELYPIEWSGIHNNIAAYYHILSLFKDEKQDDYIEKSIKHHKLSLQVSSSDWSSASGYVNLAVMYEEKKRGNRSENIQNAIEYCLQALNIYKPDYIPLEWARTQFILGQCYWALGNYEQAIQCKRYALEIYKPEIAPMFCLNIGRTLGNMAFQLQDWTNAISGYSSAIDAVETFRTNLSTDSRRKKVLTGHIDLYNNLIVAFLNSNQYDKAFEIVERSRSKYLAELMISSNFSQIENISSTLKEKLIQYENLQKQINDLHLSSVLNNEFSPQDLFRLSEEYYRTSTVAKSESIAKLEAEKQQLWLRIRELDPVLGGEIKVDAPQINQLKKLINKPSTAILNFYTIENKSYAFILRQDSINCENILGQGILLQNWIAEKWLTEYVNDQKKWQNDLPHLLSEISEKLKIKELVENCLKGIDELIIIPHLYLHLVPFSAIPINEKETLGDRFLIRYAPSCQILEFCADRPELEKNLTYGTVENATEDLPCASFEGEQIAQLYQIPKHLRLQGSEQATVKNYRQLMEQVQVLHSSHHAQSRLDNPLESSLKLADGYITLGQLLSPGWRMPNLSDVFLSCCETGLGVTEITDDILTLATGFLCAGARSVISTLWSVDDIATSIFSIIYHQNRKQGLNRPQSLQQAQIQLRTMTGKTLADTYKPLLEPMLSEKLKYSETNRKQVKKQKSQFSYESVERKNLDAEYDKWNRLSRQISQTRKRLDWLCHEEYPFENPYYWAAFVCHGLS